MSTHPGFDREAYTPRNPETQTPEELWMQRLKDAEREALIHAHMVLVFLATLKDVLSPEDALYLTAQVWRSS